MSENQNENLSQPKKRWYVVHAYSGYESYVKDVLEKTIAQEGLEDKFGEILVPKEKIVEMRSGQKKESERKYFPGYVLVHMHLDDETWHMVRNSPKVLGFIGGTSDRPAPISQKEADLILRRVQENVEGKAKPKVVFDIGEVVRVIEGPFADFNGVVEEVNYEKSRLRVAVLIFGRSTPVELEFSQVEKN
ncbi:MAG: transcription termination/antitermination protein NusG [Legionellales bacterium]|nr:transcription termination/antitermination protein NusG [Legionellales bacterium]|tara:strand:+ start:441 stop:1010 length:570 start_codon:yes stop_codon:yes gene_type:complete